MYSLEENVGSEIVIMVVLSPRKLHLQLRVFWFLQCWGQQTFRAGWQAAVLLFFKLKVKHADKNPSGAGRCCWAAHLTSAQDSSSWVLPNQVPWLQRCFCQCWGQGQAAPALPSLSPPHLGGSCPITSVPLPLLSWEICPGHRSQPGQGINTG